MTRPAADDAADAAATTQVAALFPESRAAPVLAAALDARSLRPDVIKDPICRNQFFKQQFSNTKRDDTS